MGQGESIVLGREPVGLCHLLCRAPWEDFVLSCNSDLPLFCRAGLADGILGLAFGHLPGTVLRWPWQREARLLSDKLASHCSLFFFLEESC